MKKLALVAVVLVGLALTGCSAAVDVPEKVASKAAASAAPVESAVPTVEPSAAPITIEPSTENDPTANFNGFGSQREWFLRGMADGLSGKPPSDDALIGAGALACEQLRAGTARDAVRVVEGGTDQDNANITKMAIEVYCPEFY